MLKDELKNKKTKYISLLEASAKCQYSQEYLSLRARQGKLKSKKIGRNWFTTEEWLNDYLSDPTNTNGLNGVSKEKIFLHDPQINKNYFSFFKIVFLPLLEFLNLFLKAVLWIFLLPFLFFSFFISEIYKKFIEPTKATLIFIFDFFYTLARAFRFAGNKFLTQFKKFKIKKFLKREDAREWVLFNFNNKNATSVRDFLKELSFKFKFKPLIIFLFILLTFHFWQNEAFAQNVLNKLSDIFKEAKKEAVAAIYDFSENIPDIGDFTRFFQETKNKELSLPGTEFLKKFIYETENKIGNGQIAYSEARLSLAERVSEAGHRVKEFSYALKDGFNYIVETVAEKTLSIRNRL